MIIMLYIKLSSEFSDFHKASLDEMMNDDIK